MINPICKKLLYASSCSYNLVLCYDYSSRSEFYTCIELCIKCCEGFSESEYRKIGQLITSNQSQSQDTDNNYRYGLMNFLDNSTETEPRGN